MKEKIAKFMIRKMTLLLLCLFSLNSFSQVGYLSGLNKSDQDKSDQANSEQPADANGQVNEALNNADVQDALRKALIGILQAPSSANSNAASVDGSDQAEELKSDKPNSAVNRHSYLTANQNNSNKGDWALSDYFEEGAENNKTFALVNEIGDNIKNRISMMQGNWQYLGPQFKIMQRKIVDYRGSKGFLKLLGILLLSIAFGILVERILYFFIKKKRDGVFILCNLAKENSDREEREKILEKNSIEVVHDEVESTEEVKKVVAEDIEDGEIEEEEEAEELTDVGKLDLALREEDELRLTLMTKVKSVVTLFFLDGLRLCAFAAGAFIVPSVLFGNDTVLMKEFIIACITQLITFGFFIVLFRSFIQPKCDYLRMFSLDDNEAKIFYRVILTIFFLDTFGIGSIIYFDRWGIDFNFLVIPMLLITATINFYVIYTTWRAKSFIMKIFVNKLDSDGNPVVASGNFYPIIITFGVLWIWFHWFYFLINEQFDTVKTLGLAWWITLFFPLIDRVFFIITNGIVSLYTGDSRALKKRIARLVKIFQIAFRYFLALVVVYLYLSAIDLTKVQVVSHFISELLTDVAVVFGISYIIWELVHGYIEHRFPEVENAALAALEGEGGAGGATRSETIMPLVRSFLSVILIVIISLVALSSFGIQIGPLLAGAGIVGIAIGFGAQKLVQDILSGIFFLIDDAFRKGEYIEIENLRGTVEKIALRSMQLRHHLGAVQTIPYGEIKTVKNLSRDWITMKLELRFPYDTDIEAVRKIIKKVGQSMLEDEEMGPSFILPLKSQGVMRVEESALIVRMKFTTKPGEQWVIRREAYRRVKEALEAAGVFFAHREVFVRLPGEASTQNQPVPVPMPMPDDMPEDMPDDMPGDMPKAKEGDTKSDVKTDPKTRAEAKAKEDSKNDASKKVDKAKDASIADAKNQASNLSEADIKKLKEAGAAVASSILAAEALKQGKLDGDDDRDYSE